MTNHFWIETNAPNNSKMTLNTIRSKMSHMHVSLVSLSPKFQSISLYDQPFLRQGATNSKCTEWPQTDLEHLTVKRILYTLNTTTQGPNFGPFHSMTSHFQIYRTFYNSPLTSMLNTQTGTTTKKILQIQNLKFQNSFNNFGRDHP